MTAYRLTIQSQLFPDPLGLRRTYEPVVDCPVCQRGEPFAVIGVRYGGYTCKCGATFVAAKQELETSDRILP